MPMLSEQVVDSVTATNFKTLGEVNAALYAESQKMYHQANAITMGINNNLYSAWGKSLVEADPLEAISVQKVLSGNDVSQQLAAIGGAIASIQQFIKGAQTTPPPTA